MPTWITDFGHLVPEHVVDAPVAARRRASFTREVVEAATSRPVESHWSSAVRCIGRVKGKLCRGWIDVGYDGRDTIEWQCARCGDQGTVTGFAGSASDLSPYVPCGKTVTWGFDDQDRKLLTEATTDIPELRAVIARARPNIEIAGLLLLRATVAELDQMYTLVEELTDLTRSWQRREVLDGLRMSLSTSIDGF